MTTVPPIVIARKKTRRRTYELSRLNSFTITGAFVDPTRISRSGAPRPLQA